MNSQHKRIESKSDLRSWLEYERSLYDGSFWRAFLRVREEDILWHLIVLLRYTEYFMNTNKRLRSTLAKILLYRYENRYQIHVPPNTCGKGLSIAHVGLIVINSKASIGENTRVNVGVNIGANHGEAPLLGGGVYIGPGAKVFGDIIIADNVRIGANAVVNKSCKQEGALLVGVPACVK